jgi:Photosynthesis system II assembly factor YCF48/Putative zinc-finger
MCARSDQSDPRDQAMDRLLADALKPAASPGAACPDAERVAAYADRGLTDTERVRLEAHFAGCEHCQGTLAALGAALEAPVVGETIAAMPAPAGAAAAPRVAARPAHSPQRWLWWLSPAFGAAAAVLLWMALRPAAPQPVPTAANFPATNEQETRALNAPAASSPQPQAPPAAAAGALRDEVAADPLAQAPPAENKTVGATQERAFAQLAAPRADATPPAAPPAPAVRSEVAAALPPPPPPVPTAGNQAAAAAAGGTAGGRFRSPPTITEELPLVNSTSATLGGTLSNQTVSDLPVTARSVAQLNLYSPTYTFTSPEGGVQWRVGAAGLIQKSTDNGGTWQQQSSGVTSDLTAGSASSANVAWVVGRGRVILRATDGQRWERIDAPAGMTSEWAAVAAYDAMTATVVAEDLRRFSTEDGGRTWTEQQ